MGAILMIAVGSRWADETSVVGPTSDGGFLVATSQQVRPAGNVLTYGGRPVDMNPAPDGKTLYVKDEKGVTVLDAAWKVRQSVAFPKEGGGSLHGIAVSRDGKKVWATGAGNTLWELAVADDGKLSVGRGIILPGPAGKGASFPCGMAISRDEKTFYVCLSRNNTLAVVDAPTGKVRTEIPVGVAPYAVVLSADGNIAWVSDWGGRRPKAGEPTADSSGTPTRIDSRGVAAGGTVSPVDLATETSAAPIPVGRHPSAMVASPDGKTLFVANTNDDSVSAIDTTRRVVVRTLPVKPDAALPYGSQPNALTLTPDGKTLYVACGGNNAVAALDSQTGTIRGWIPAGWYPSALTTSGDSLLIASVKGLGSRRPDESEKQNKGWNVYQYQGTINRVAFPDEAQLRQGTAQIVRDARITEALQENARARPNAAPIPIPQRAGEPSVIRHIVYIIKENRTYDQILGDLKQGDGDPALCLYGREVTPNHHALAEQFVLLDNFYCNGVLSADGHSWATEGNNTDHLEKSFGGFTRSYTFGDDPLTYSSTGFLWDKVLDKGLTFRNYGEMDYTDEKPDVSYTEILKDWQNKAGENHVSA